MFKEHPLKQDWSQDLPKYYFDHSPCKTHFFNALSVTFPQGERYFIDSVKHYKDRIDCVRQQEEISVFVKQENWHRYAHQQYNSWLENQGMPVEQLENLVTDKIEFIKKKFRPRAQLASTVCLEHITAIFAEHLLSHPEILRKLHPHFRQTWKWHAIEEIEHKSVAMNVYNSIGGKSLRFAMLMTTINFTWDITRNTILLLKADGQLWKWRTLKDAIGLMFDKNTGFVRKMFKPWLAFMRKDFHPDDIDNTGLLLQYSKG